MSFTHRSLKGLLPGITFLTALGAGGIAQADTATFSLPRGVHRTATGRYTVPMCDDKLGFNCLGRWLLPETWQPGQPLPERQGGVPLAAPSSGMKPSDVLAAYNIPSTSAANGKIVAILDAPDNHALTDLNGYRSAYGLPTMQRCSGMPSGSGTPCFAQINYDGQPSTGTDPSPNDDGETSLDMDMVSAGCPDCSILLVEITTNFCEHEFVQGVATASKLGASAISISIGGAEATDPNALSIDAGPGDGAPPQCPIEANWAYDQPGPYSSPGHLVFVASGDFAYDNNNMGLTATIGAASPSYPASSPYVVSVGGTTLYNDGAGHYGEGVWNNGSFGLFDGTQGTGQYQDITTSGCSTEFTMPPWQASVLSGTGCAKRATADIAAAASYVNGTKVEGIEIYMSGQFGGAEGTSASAPLVAAIFTRLGLTTEASNDLSWMYKNISAFNDVGGAGYPIPSGAATSDSNAASCGKLCTAGTGWDGPTGVGSPNGKSLAALPVSTSGPAPYPDAGVPEQNMDAGTGPSDASSKDGSSSGTQGSGADASTGGNGASGNGSSSGCNVGPEGGSAAGAGWLATVVGLALLRARRRRQPRG